MKLFFIILIVLSTSFIGLLIYLNYNSKRKTYSYLVDFCDTCLLEIKFNKNNFKKIIEKNLSSYNLEMKKILNCYLDKECYTSKIFKKSDTVFIQNFIDSLGKKDIDGEIQNLNKFKELFDQNLKKSKEDEQKKGVLSFKLLIVVGLLLGIMLAWGNLWVLM